MDAILTDYRSAPIEEKLKALLSLIEKINRDSTSIGAEDMALARALGWSDEALYDAFTVCALFHFYNKWIDATGVPDMPAQAYEQSGQRLAHSGYHQEP